MSPYGKPSLIELMSSNNGFPPNNIDSDNNGKLDRSVRRETIHGQQIEQLLLQQQHQPQLMAVVNPQTQPQWQHTAAPSVTDPAFLPQPQNQQYLETMLKRTADEADASIHSQKRARNGTLLEEQEPASLPWFQQPSDQLNRTWIPSSSIEPTPFRSSPGTGGAGNSLSNLDFLGLRDSAIANPAFATSPSLASNKALAEQLRLTSELKVTQLLNEQIAGHNTLTGSLSTTTPPHDSLFPVSDSPAQVVLPTATSSVAFAPAAAGNPMGELVPFPAFTSSQARAAAPLPTQTVIPATELNGPAGPAMSSNDQAILNLMMQQLASVQNPGPFLGSLPTFAQSAMNFPSAASAMESELATLPFNIGSSATSTTGGIVPANVGSSSSLVATTKPLLPPLDEDRVPHYSERPMFALGIDEDSNWLSEFHCFVRSELAEVSRASREDCKTRNNAITYEQVGIRCRFCAHKPSSSRAGRSAAFPSSCRQIYQSFTMMFREHFPNCESIPQDLREKFIILKDTQSQGATDSKRYWVYAAMKLGLVDTKEGILIDEQTIRDAAKLAPFGSDSSSAWPDDATKSIALVMPSDEQLVDPFVLALLSQVQVVRLAASEQIGNRRSLLPGLPGIACRYCCQQQRLGLCRLFPARRRTLPDKVGDMYDHLRRCSLVPVAVKQHLAQLKENSSEEAMNDREDCKAFFDRVWDRMGHSAKPQGLATQK